MRTPIIIKLFDDTIQLDRSVKVEDVAHSLNISVGIAHEIIHKDLGYQSIGVIVYQGNARLYTASKTVKTINQLD